MFSDFLELKRIININSYTKNKKGADLNGEILSGGIQRDVMQSSEAQLDFLIELEEITGEKILTEKRGGVSDANIVSSSGIIRLVMVLNLLVMVTILFMK